jgi:NAD(P)H-flavin reductase
MADSMREWDGERGHVDAAMLGRHLDGVVNPIYYMAGPPGMVQETRTMLVASGVDEDDIRTEEFTGY